MAGTGIGSVVSQWQGQFEGRLFTPADEAYEASRRIWNGMIDIGRRSLCDACPQLTSARP